MTMHKNFDIYINENAGTVKNLGRTAIEDIISTSNLGINHVYFLPAKDLFKRLKSADKNARILIGGGDGTIRSAAKTLMKSGRGFGILPMGTMNLLAKDLDIPLKLDETLRAYADNPKKTAIDAGIVNNKEIFLCCAGIGTMPETSKYRERYRDDSEPVLIPRLTAYVLRQMDKAARRKMTLNIDGKKKKLKAAALVISNNQYGPQGQWNEENFLRPSLQDGILGLYAAAPRSFWEKLRLLLKLKIGDWKKDDALREWSAKNLIVTCDNKSLLLSLDGETCTFHCPIHFGILEKQINLWVPK